MKTINRQKLILSIGIGLSLCLPVTGFIFGFIACSDCENSISGFFMRIFIGFVHIITTIITLGKPWVNEAGNSSTNIRIYVLITFVFLTAITYSYRKDGIK